MCGTAGNLETDAGSLFYLPAPHSHEAASFQGTPSPALWPADLPFTFGVMRLAGNGKPVFLPQCPSQASMSASHLGR